MICENIKCSKLHNGSYGSGRFCSKKCAFSREGLVGDRNPNWQGGKTIKFCKECSKRLSRNNQSGYCRSCSSLAENNAFYGKRHSEETRLKMVESAKLRDRSTYKSGRAPLGVHSAIMKRNWTNYSDEKKKEIVGSFIIAGLKASKKSSLTKIENIVNNILIKHLFSFKRNYQIGIFNVDFLVGNKVIECLGDYWHCNPIIYGFNYYNKSIKLSAKEKWDKDHNRKVVLEKRGLSVLMLWENEIKNNIDTVEDKILNFLR